MMLADAVRAIYESFPAEDALAVIERLSALDRYQASAGIVKAASQVAELAEKAGLKSVEVRSYPADGSRRWWTFQAPESWTPVEARLEISDPSWFEVTGYPRDACCLATHSAPTGPTGPIEAPLVEYPGDARQMQGAMVVLAPGGVGPRDAVEVMRRVGAIGFVCVAGSGDDPDRVGRLELEQGGGVFAFSISPAAMTRVAAAAKDGGRARALVRVETGATMPLVTGELPGGPGDEVLLLAHLCHPRPGANDNLSGVAALLGLARVLRDRGEDLAGGIRFIWAPEFVGTAAYLHDLSLLGARLPMCVINLDMVGEDQSRCGGPLTIERSPDHIPSYIDALIESAVEYLPATKRGWSWASVPFLGASDHALFADRSVARPAVHIGHATDRFNHSSDDTLDKVDPDELRRSAALAGAVVSLVAARDHRHRTEIESVTSAWAARRLARSLTGADDRPPHDPDVIDPRSQQEARAHVAHTAEVAAASIRSLSSIGISPSPAALAALEAQRDSLMRRMRGGPRPGKEPLGPPVRRLWPGPFNLRSLTQDVSGAERGWLGTHARPSYAIFTAIAHAIDDGSSRLSVLRRAAHSSLVPIPIELGNRFIDAMIGAGWATESKE